MWFFVAGCLHCCESNWNVSSGFVNYLWWGFYRLWRSRDAVLFHTEGLHNACISSLGPEILPLFNCPANQWCWSSNVCCHIVEKGFWGLFWKTTPQKLQLTHIMVHVFVSDLALFFLPGKVSIWNHSAQLFTLVHLKVCTHHFWVNVHILVGSYTWNLRQLKMKGLRNTGTVLYIHGMI